MKAPRHERVSQLLGSSEDRFVAAVEAIYGAATQPADWPIALQAVADCFGDLGAGLDYAAARGSHAVISSPGLQKAADDYNGGWHSQNIRNIRTAERGLLASVDTITDRHLVTLEEMEAHPFYAEYLISHGLRWFAGTVIASDPGVWIGLAVHRAPDKPPFNNEELATLTRLGRHVEKALRLGIRLINAEMASLAFGDVLSRLDVAVFLLDEAGRILLANPLARELIGDGFLTAAGRLTARYAPDLAALESAIHAASGYGTESLNATLNPILVHGLDPGRFLAVYVSPARLPTGHAVEQLLTNARAVVVAIASKAGEPTDPAIVRDILGLTLGEARLAALVGSGLPPRGAAEQLGITEQTARTTLKRVFAKVGVSRQSELAALLSRLVLR